MEAVAKMKSAPGKDGVRLCYINEASQEIKAELEREVGGRDKNRADGTTVQEKRKELQKQLQRNMFVGDGKYGVG